MNIKADRNLLKITICTLAVFVLMIVGGSNYMYNNGLSGKYENTQAKEGQIKVACIGDSITYGHGISDWTKNCYPAVLQELLGEKYHVANFGSSGACVNPEGDQPYIKRDIYQAALEYDADIIIFMLGTNDAKPENWTDVSTFMEDYKALIASLTEGEDAPIVYYGICAEAFYTEDADKTTGIAKYDIQPSVVDEIADAIRRQGVSSIAPVRLVDIHSITENHPEWFEADGIHPNNDGAKAIAEAVANAIMQQE